LAWPPGRPAGEARRGFEAAAIRLGLIALFAVAIWAPSLPSPATVEAASACTGWSSSVTPPTTIKVMRVSRNTVETVDFRTYVRTVMAAEWPASWPAETLRAGAVAVKQYAWYYAMHYRGGSGPNGCYDVSDNSNDQIYTPESYTPTTSQIQAVSDTWGESLLKSGSLILTGYRPGSDVACGADADGYHLFQGSARRCGLNGLKGEAILLAYYSGTVVQNPPGLPGPPTAVTGLPMDSAVWVSWHTPDDTGNADIDTYVVTASPGGQSCSTTGALNCVVTNLNDGDPYTFTVVATNYAGSGPASAPSDPVTPVTGPPTYYSPLPPARILDTRHNVGLTGVFHTRIARTFTVAGSGGVPAGATAVTGNLTVTNQTGRGYVYVGPIAMDTPTSSTLNFPTNDNRANAVTVALGPGGTLGITYVASSLGSFTADVIFDVTGFFSVATDGATYTPLDPARILDTRHNVGLTGSFATRVGRTLTVAGFGGVPSDATAVTGTVTVTNQTSRGYIYVGPATMNTPTSSTLNFPTGDNRANAVTVALDDKGRLGITYVASNLGSFHADVIFDVTGFFSAASDGATYKPLNPARILDTRHNVGLTGSFATRVARTFPVAGFGGVPADATAVTGNVTVTNQTGRGYIYVGPTPMNIPTSSTLNFPTGDNRANAVTVALDDKGQLSITYVASSLGSYSADVIFDVTGYFVPAATP